MLAAIPIVHGRAGTAMHDDRPSLFLGAHLFFSTLLVHAHCGGARYLKTDYAK
jgi:hypothetical protein